MNEKIKIEDEENLLLLDSEEEQSDNVSTRCISKTFLNELKINAKMGFPVLITNVFQYSLNIETTSFCGRLSSTELEGVGLALSILSAFGWCVCSGMISACDTMFSQKTSDQILQINAHLIKAVPKYRVTNKNLIDKKVLQQKRNEENRLISREQSFGSDNKKRTGLFLQRAFLMMNLIPLFLWAWHINSEPILILLGQNQQISRVSGEFLTYFTPGIIFMVNYLIMARYMQDQGCLWPAVIAGLCGNVFNICTQLLFVSYLEFGFKAAALCHAFSFGIMVLIEALYILKSKFYMATWPGFQLEALADWGDMFRLGLAGVGHVTFEVIIWEASVFMGGLLGNIELATQSILLQILSFLFMMYYGAGIASNIRVGQCLGANRPSQAKLAYRAGMLNIGIATVICGTLIIILRNQIPYIFTNKQDVIEKIQDVMPFMFLLMYTDPFSGVLSATIRGCGRQFTGCLIIFVSFYILSLPSSIILGFVLKMSIKGIWIGNTIGSVVSGVIISILLECQDWKHQAHLAQRRIQCNMASTKNVETEYLIASFHLGVENEKKSPSHIRTPSYPVTCSTAIVELPKPKLNIDKSIIWKRIIIAGCVFLFLLCGIFIHVFLPVEIYRQMNSTTGAV